MIRSDRGMEGSVNTSGVKVGMVGRGVGDVGRGIGVEGIVVRNDTVGRSKNTGVAVGMALCVSAKAVLTVGVERKLLQEASMAVRNKEVIVLSKIFTLHLPLMFCKRTPNGLR
jgi:hypothetical protein